VWKIRRKMKGHDERTQHLRVALPALVLTIVEDNPGIHGPAIAELISQKSNTLLSMGTATIYPVLYGLSESGALRSEADTNKKGVIRRVYFITESGKKTRIEKSDSLLNFCTTIASIIGGQKNVKLS
jgi:DNA-binding PadR family transcriptional regulator